MRAERPKDPDYRRLWSVDLVLLPNCDLAGEKELA
jgi:hypothetical protein